MSTVFLRDNRRRIVGVFLTKTNLNTTSFGRMESFIFVIIVEYPHFKAPAIKFEVLIQLPLRGIKISVNWNLTFASRTNVVRNESPEIQRPGSEFTMYPNLKYNGKL